MPGDIDLDAGYNTVLGILARLEGKDITIRVAETDLVFITNGSLTQNSTFGDNTTVALVDRSTEGRGVFTLWEKLAKKHEKFGHPEKFIGDIDRTKWISFFPTIKGYPQFIQKLEELTERCEQRQLPASNSRDSPINQVVKWHRSLERLTHSIQEC
jgi:oleate hydratase